MSTIVRGSISEILRPGINRVYGLAYEMYPAEYKQVFEVKKSSLNYERDVNIYPLGTAVVKPESTGYTDDTMGQGFAYNYVHVPYALRFSATREAIADGQYIKIIMEGTKSLAKAMLRAKEIVHANVFNLAFSAEVPYADGLSLCNSNNLNSGGGTFSNRLAIDADLSEAALEEAILMAYRMTDDRGNLIRLMPKRLVIPTALTFEAARILKSPLRVATTDNDINAIKSAGLLGDPFVYHYLTDDNAWFVLTDAEKGLTSFEREPVSVETHVDDNTDNVFVKAYERYSCGVTDKRCIIGSAGV